jgi:hypothetical protein
LPCGDTERTCTRDAVLVCTCVVWGPKICALLGAALHAGWCKTLISASGSSGRVCCRLI